MELIGTADNIFQVGEPLGQTSRYNLYECTLPDDTVGILKIAADISHNPLLDREAFLLRTMREEAFRLEREYAKVKTDDKGKLNYQFCFPEVIDCFASKEQGGRRVSILSFSAIAEELEELVPLSHIMSKDGLRIDPRTSGWIMGKLLKLLVFTHSQGISSTLTGENILLNTKEHYIAVFDWTEATITDGVLANGLAVCEISQAAREVILAMGGDIETGAIPPDDDLPDSRYESMLFELASGNVESAKDAHAKFYDLILALWPRGFHPFTGYPVE